MVKIENYEDFIFDEYDEDFIFDKDFLYLPCKEDFIFDEEHSYCLFFQLL